jgi:hypothetical protein
MGSRSLASVVGDNSAPRKAAWKVSAIGYFKTLRPVARTIERDAYLRRAPRRHDEEGFKLPVGAGSPDDCFPFSADPKSVEHALRDAHDRLDVAAAQDGRIVLYGKLPPGAASHFQRVPRGW